MNQELVEKSQSNIVQHQAQSNAFIDAGFDAKDVLIPKILLMQGLSVLVTEGKAVMGDIVNSVTQEKLGDKNNHVEFIPISGFKTWQISVKDEDDEYKFDKNVPFTPENATWQYEQKDELGRDVKNVLCLNFYVILPKEIAGGEAFPYVITFRSTSRNAGKQLATHFMNSALFKKAPYGKTMKLGCFMDKNDKGPYYVYEVKPGRAATQEEIDAVKIWLPVIASGSAKVDTSDDLKAESSAVATSTMSKDF